MQARDIHGASRSTPGKCPELASWADTPGASVNVVAPGVGSLRAAPSEVSLETRSVEARRGGAGMSYAGGSLEAGEA
jgi:hypothetical protein